MVSITEYQGQLAARRQQLEEAQRQTSQAQFAAPIRPQAELRSTGIQRQAQVRGAIAQARTEFGTAKSQALQNISSELQTQQQLENELAPQIQAVKAYESQLADISAYKSAKKDFEKGIPISSVKGKEKQYLKEFYNDYRAAKDSFRNVVDKFQKANPTEKLVIDSSRLEIKGVNSTAFGMSLPIEDYLKKLKQPSPISNQVKQMPLSRDYFKDYLSGFKSPTPQLKVLEGYKAVSLPQRGTVAAQPRPEFAQTTPGTFSDFIAIPSKVSSATVKGTGGLVQAGSLEIIRTLAPGYTGRQVKIAAQPIYQRSTLLDTGRPALILPETTVTSLSPETISKGAGLLTSAGTAGLIYSTPVVAPIVLTSETATGVSTFRQPIPNVESLKIKPEPRPEGVTLEDYNKYLQSVKDYNRAQEEYVASLRLQKTLGGIQAVASGGFLAYKGYKSATQPIIIRGAKPKTIYSPFRATIKDNMGEIEFQALQPERQGLITNPAKELLFFGSGKNIDLAKTFVVSPERVSLIKGTFLLNDDKSIGVGTAIKGKTTPFVKTIEIGPDNFGNAQPAIVVNDKTVRYKVPKDINIFEVKSAKVEFNPDDFGKLNAAEKKILLKISDKGGISVMPTDSRYFASEVQTAKGAGTPPIRITKYSTKTRRPSEIEIKNLLESDISKSMQITQVEGTPFIDTGTVQGYRAKVGIKKVTGLIPSARGNIETLSGNIFILDNAASTGGDVISGVKTSTKVGTSQIGKIQRTSEVIGQLTKQVPKPVINVPKITPKTSAFPLASIVATKVVQVPTITTTATSKPILKVEQAQQVKQKQEQKPAVALATGQIANQINYLGQANRQFSIVAPVFSVTQPTSEIQLPREIQEPITSQGQIQSPVQRPRQTLIFGSPFPGKPPAIPIILTTPTFTPGEEEELKKKRKRKKKVVPLTGFEVQIRRRGKFRPFSEFSYNPQEAFAIGARETLGTSAATFRIRPSSQPLVSLGQSIASNVINLFRRPKGGAAATFVQRRNVRITSPGEIREIALVGARNRKSKNRGIFFK